GVLRLPGLRKSDSDPGFFWRRGVARIRPKAHPGLRSWGDANPGCASLYPGYVAANTSGAALPLLRGVAFLRIGKLSGMRVLALGRRRLLLPRLLHAVGGLGRAHGGSLFGTGRPACSGRGHACVQELAVARIRPKAASGAPFSCDAPRVRFAYPGYGVVRVRPAYDGRDASSLARLSTTSVWVTTPFATVMRSSRS